MVFVPIPLVHTPAYAHGGFYACYDMLNILLQQTEAEEGGEWAVLNESLPFPGSHGHRHHSHSSHHGQHAHLSMRMLENHPTLAALGHVLEHMTQLNGEGETVFDKRLRHLCAQSLRWTLAESSGSLRMSGSEGDKEMQNSGAAVREKAGGTAMDQATASSSAPLVKNCQDWCPPRPVEWDIYIDVPVWKRHLSAVHSEKSEPGRKRNSELDDVKTQEDTSSALSWSWLWNTMTRRRTVKTAVAARKSARLMEETLRTRIGDTRNDHDGYNEEEEEEEEEDDDDDDDKEEEKEEEQGVYHDLYGNNHVDSKIVNKRKKEQGAVTSSLIFLRPHSTLATRSRSMPSQAQPFVPLLAPSPAPSPAHLERHIAVSHGSVFSIVREAFGISSYSHVAPSAFTPSQWLCQYVRVLLALVDPTQARSKLADDVWKQLREFKEMRDWNAPNMHEQTSRFFQDVWPHLFLPRRDSHHHSLNPLDQSSLHRHHHSNINTHSSSPPKEHDASHSHHQEEYNERSQHSSFLPHFSVLLDVKSRRAPPFVLQQVVACANAFGVHISGVGSFSFTQVSEVDEVSQIFFSVSSLRSSLVLPPPQPVLFLHTVGDVVLHGRHNIPPHTHCYFNGSSLVHLHISKTRRKAHYLPKGQVLHTLERIVRRVDIKLGVYVQEHQIHAKALAAVIALINAHPNIFPLGFAYGGINGLAHAESDNASEIDVFEGVQHGEKVDVGLGLQRWIGRSDSGHWFF